MVSPTQQTWSIRTSRRKRAGRKRKRMMAAKGTPKFPIHPEGYDLNAPDAKPNKT